MIRRFYDQEWNARSLYHMLLNSAIGFDAMIEAALAATGLRQATEIREQESSES